jgi:hypothetical protein
MSNPAPAPQDPASPAPDEVPDPAVLRAERRLRLLEELTEIGMELARALRPGVSADEPIGEAAGGDPATDNVRGRGRDLADALARLSRAVRLTMALEARTDEELRDLKSGIVRVRDQERAKAAERAEHTAHIDHLTRRGRVSYLVASLAEAEIGDEGEFENLCAALEERLEEDAAYEDCDKWPLRETVERLCKDLALTPDWSRWAGEDWSVDDATGRSPFSPFREPSARPILSACPRPPQALVPSGRLQPTHHLE